MLNPPNLFLVGVPRAGTTSLANALGEHSRVYLCPLKEPHYYAYDSTSFSGPGDDWLERNWSADRQAYAAQFADAPAHVQYRLDASTNYFHDSAALERILTDRPDARFVAVLRNPEDRARSAHQFLTWQGHETASFTEALAAEAERQADGWSQIWRYGSDSHYADSLERFIAIVPESQRLVLLFDDFDDWPATRAVLFAFLGLEPEPIELAHLNAKGAAPAAGVALLLNRPSDLRTRIGNSPLGRVLRPILNSARAMASRFAPAVAPEPIPVALAESWAADRQRTATLLGRDLGRWAT